MAANVPIYINQGGTEMVIGAGGTFTAEAGSTLNFDAGTIDIPDNSVGTAQLQANAVTTAKITDLNVTTGKLALLAVDTAQLAANAVTTAKITDLNVTTGKLALLAVDTGQIAANAVTAAKIANATITSTQLANNAVVTAGITDANVTTAKLAAGAVTKAKAGLFISAEQTGTQTMIAHGLGVNPTAANVIVAATDTSGTDVPGVYSVAIAADATNVSVTVTGGALKYKVMAWAP